MKDWTDFRGADHIDSRDLIAAAEELREELAESERDPSPDVAEFLAAVEDLAGECSEWEYGAHLIREDCFEDYARELAEDIGAMPEGNNWPAYCIDWERAARELAMDYSLVTFLGNDYYVRD